jgi:peptidoglycan/LPS O-acetylase OafA/YrhL
MSTLLATPPKTDQAYKTASMGRLPALDGWRGVAIILVLFDHIQVALLGRYEYPWMQTGQHGVTIFFVLSGFLITSKLVDGPIDLRHFYLRRFFRLMPAAWTYLAVLLLLSRLTCVSFTSLPEVSACLFFYRNMVDVPGPGLAGHFWSLSLEEQFYLVWPCLLFLTGSKRCVWIAATGVCACALYRWVLWSHYDRLGPNDMSQVRADALLVGCVMALLLSNPRARLASARWAKWTAIPALMMLLFCVARFQWLPPLRECASIAILISTCVLFQGSIWPRLLSWRPLTWLGDVSYSIYLWQELFVHLGCGTGRLFFLLLALPLFALGSFYLIERPITQFGRRVAVLREERIGTTASS